LDWPDRPALLRSIQDYVLTHPSDGRRQMKRRDSPARVAAVASIILLLACGSVRWIYDPPASLVRSAPRVAAMSSIAASPMLTAGYSSRPWTGVSLRSMQSAASSCGIRKRSTMSHSEVRYIYDEHAHPHGVNIPAAHVD
jgi:hypothetical protein